MYTKTFSSNSLSSLRCLPYACMQRNFKHRIGQATLNLNSWAMDLIFLVQI